MQPYTVFTFIFQLQLTFKIILCKFQGYSIVVRQSNTLQSVPCPVAVMLSCFSENGTAISASVSLSNLIDRQTDRQTDTDTHTHIMALGIYDTAV